MKTFCKRHQECYNGGVGVDIKSYIHIGSSTELTGADRRLYRFFEILPGFLSWSTLIGMVLLSWQKPVWAAVFIIIFDLYWLIKTVFLSFHLRLSYRRLREHMATDWQKKLQELEKHAEVPLPLNSGSGTSACFVTDVYQLIILPFYKENETVVRETLEVLAASRWPKERMLVVLG